MARSIDYYFSFASPWAAIGHDPFMDVVRRHGAQVNCRPVFLGEVFAETGGLPLAKRHPARQRYRMLELQRWRLKRGIALNTRPAFWPFDPTLADKTAVVAIAVGHDPDPFMRRVFAGVWQHEQNLADPAVLRAALTDSGLPGDLVDEAAGATAADAYRANREAAVAADVFGSPAYVLDGEVFWGQDRIDLLDDALSSGRAPFTPAP